MGIRIASPRNVPETPSVASPSVFPLPHDPPAEPQLPFLISKSMLTDVGPVELWATRSVVQAQRQIHRALRAAFMIAELVVRTMAEQPALTVPRHNARIGRHGTENHSLRCLSSPILQATLQCPQLPVRVNAWALHLQSLQ